MARVHLSGELRTRCDGAAVVEVDAVTVLGLVAELERRFPALASAHLRDMTVAIDGDIVANADYEPVGPQSDVHFLPALSGG